MTIRVPAQTGGRPPRPALVPTPPPLLFTPCVLLSADPPPPLPMHTCNASRSTNSKCHLHIPPRVLMATACTGVVNEPLITPPLMRLTGSCCQYTEERWKRRQQGEQGGGGNRDRGAGGAGSPRFRQPAGEQGKESATQTAARAVREKNRGGRGRGCEGTGERRRVSIDKCLMPAVAAGRGTCCCQLACLPRERPRGRLQG